MGIGILGQGCISLYGNAYINKNVLNTNHYTHAVFVTWGRTTAEDNYHSELVPFGPCGLRTPITYYSAWCKTSCPVSACTKLQLWLNIKVNPMPPPPPPCIVRLFSALQNVYASKAIATQEHKDEDTSNSHTIGVNSETDHMINVIRPSEWGLESVYWNTWVYP